MSSNQSPSNLPRPPHPPSQVRPPSPTLALAPSEVFRKLTSTGAIDRFRKSLEKLLQPKTLARHNSISHAAHNFLQNTLSSTAALPHAKQLLQDTEQATIPSVRQKIANDVQSMAASPAAHHFKKLVRDAFDKIIDPPTPNSNQPKPPSKPSTHPKTNHQPHSTLNVTPSSTEYEQPVNHQTSTKTQHVVDSSEPKPQPHNQPLPVPQSINPPCSTEETKPKIPQHQPHKLVHPSFHHRPGPPPITTTPPTKNAQAVENKQSTNTSTHATASAQIASTLELFQTAHQMLQLREQNSHSPKSPLPQHPKPAQLTTSPHQNRFDHKPSYLNKLKKGRKPKSQNTHRLQGTTSTKKHKNPKHSSTLKHTVSKTETARLAHNSNLIPSNHPKHEAPPPSQNSKLHIKSETAPESPEAHSDQITPRRKPNVRVANNSRVKPEHTAPDVEVASPQNPVNSHSNMANTQFQITQPTDRASIARRDPSRKKSRDGAADSRKKPHQHQGTSKQNSPKFDMEKQHPHKSRKRKSSEISLPGSRPPINPKNPNYPRAYNVTKPFCIPEDYEDQCKVLQALTKLLEKDFADPFAEPLDTGDEGCSSYLQVIVNPMDIGTIVKRIKASSRKRAFFNNVNEIYEDIELVWWNCAAFNGKFDPVVDAMERCKIHLSIHLENVGISSGGLKKQRRRSAKVVSPPIPVEDELMERPKKTSITSISPRTPTTAGSPIATTSVPASNVLNDGLLLGKQGVIFRYIEGQNLKRWCRCTISAFDSSTNSYSIVWDDNTVTKGATIGPGCMFNIHRF